MIEEPCSHCSKTNSLLVVLTTQTQNAACFERKGRERKPLAPREASESQETIALRFLNASVSLRKALSHSLFWGFPFEALFPETHVIEHRVVERNANQTQTQELGTLHFRTRPSSFWNSCP